MPELSARGILLMQQFYNVDGSKKINEPVELPYPKLKDFDIYNNRSVEQQEICVLNDYIKILTKAINEKMFDVALVIEEGEFREKIKNIKSKRIFEP